MGDLGGIPRPRIPNQAAQNHQLTVTRPSQVERNRPPVRFTVERWNVTATVEVGHESMGIYIGCLGGWLGVGWSCCWLLFAKCAVDSFETILQYVSNHWLTV